MKLFAHNQRAYDAVMTHYKNNKRACVIQPCGTGKSYVLAAVASNFDKVYVIAPNEYVLNQAQSACEKEVTCQTYSLISTDNYDIPTNADLIVFDEMHRMGATSWSKGCERFMSANPDAYILGLTATPVRALEQRDMTQEYFQGHVVSNMSLSDAWCQKVLKAPQKYVVGLVSMDNDKRDRIEKINNSRWLNDEQKKSACAKVINLCRDWALGNGVPRIISKYWDSNIKKCVVFAPTINAAETLEPTIRGWFSEAGHPVNKVYVAHSESEAAAKTIADFESNDEGLNILISVSMLNEGIHPKGVSAAILLRATISRNLYMQQIGRCFSVGQEVAPIIFDLSDNLTSANGYDEIYVARERFLREGGYIDEKSESASERHENLDTFQIIDTIKSTRDLMAEIDRTCHIVCTTWTIELCKAEALKYQSRRAFYLGSTNAYSAAKAHGWLDEVCSHMTLKSKSWTKKECQTEALKYTSRREFSKKGHKQYFRALKMGWLDEICAHMPLRKISWTEDMIRAEASKYKTIGEFYTGNNRAYSAAKRRNLLRSLFPDSLVRRVLSDEDLVTIAKSYTSRQEFRQADISAYTVAEKRGILDAICAHMSGLPRIVYTKEMVIEAAKGHTKQSFKQECCSMYYMAQRNGWLQECFPNEKFRTMWTFESCKAEAAKYESKIDFVKHGGGAYQYAKKNGILTEVCKHMKQLTKWTYETALAEAKKYKSSYELQKNAKGAYNYIHANKQLTKEVAEFYKTPVTGSWTKEKCFEVAGKCSSMQEFRDSYAGAYRHAIRNGFARELYDAMNWLSNSPLRWTKEICIEEAKKYKSYKEFYTNCRAATAYAKRQGFLEEIKQLYTD